jgi:phospholipase/carboxylesterase
MKVSGIIFLFLISVFISFSQKITTELTYSVYPSKLKTNAPVMIFLHGYGSNEADLFDISKALDERFITFSLRAPLNAKEVGYCWYDLNFLPNKQITSNYTQAKESRTKILSFISSACKVYKADSTKVFLMGFSQGAIMAYDLALNDPKKIAGIMALSGKLLEDSKAAKLDTAAVAKVKFFIAHGYSDNIIDIKEAQKANDFLKEKKIRDLVYKNYEMSHALSGAELNDIKAWLKKALVSQAKDPENKK